MAEPGEGWIPVRLAKARKKRRRPSQPQTPMTIPGDGWFPVRWPKSRKKRFRPNRPAMWMLRELTMTWSSRVTFSQTLAASSVSILNGVPAAHPVHFVRAPDGKVFFVNGLVRPHKWDGVRYAAEPVGVPAPTAALTLAADVTTITITPATATSTNTSISELDISVDANGAVTGSVTGQVTCTVSGQYNDPRKNQPIATRTHLLSVAAIFSGGITGNMSGEVWGKESGNSLIFAGKLKGRLTGSGGTTVIGYIFTVGYLPGAGTYTRNQDQAEGTFNGTADGVTTDSGNVGEGAFISGTYYAYQRWLDRDGNPSNLSPISNPVTVGSATNLLYTNVQAPTDPKITRRQILRNTDGQALTFYVDVDTEDLAATSFSSTRTDANLETQTAVPLFDAQGNSLANRYGLPPYDKPIMVAYLDRMFAAGEVVYQEGMAEVTNDSATVTGIATAWTSAMAARFFYVVGAGRHYEISSVSESAQTLTLTEVWQGATDKLAVYSIRSAPAQRRTVYFAEAGLPEAWPATNGLTIEDTGDEITGLMVADSYLYILLRRHTYRLSYLIGPLVDGGIFLAAKRGCVNQRCWVYADGVCYAMDEQGCYKFSGGNAETISQAVQDLFQQDHPKGALRINWKAQKWFHALHSQDERCVRWFVALSGSRLPRHALCFNYDSGLWWVEEYPFPLGHSCVTDGERQRPLVCGPARRVFAHAEGNLDGPDPDAGTTRGTAAGGLVEGLTGPATAAFASDRLVGMPVVIVDGTGKTQVNLVASVSSATIRCVNPWITRPDSTSVFQLGGFTWRWMSGLLNWVNVEGNQERRFTLLFEPCASDAQLDMRITNDFASAPENYGYDWPATSKERDAVRVAKNSPDAVVDLTFQYGFAQVRRSGRNDLFVWNASVFTVELRGVNAENVVKVHELVIEGAE